MNDKEALFSAIKAGDLELARSLVQADPALAAADEAGGSAVLLAVYYGRAEMVPVLLGAGQPLNIWEASAVGQRARVLELLAQQPALVNAPAPDGFAPLGLAVFFGHPAVMETLLAGGAAVNQPSRNAMQVQPLHSAVAHTDPAQALRMARRLLDEGADPNAVQSGGWTPLHEAARRGHMELAALLLRSGAKAEARNDDGQTPLDLARAEAQAEMARFLEGA